MLPKIKNNPLPFFRPGVQKFYKFNGAGNKEEGVRCFTHSVDSTFMIDEMKAETKLLKVQEQSTTWWLN